MATNGTQTANGGAREGKTGIKVIVVGAGRYTQLQVLLHSSCQCMPSAPPGPF